MVNIEVDGGHHVNDAKQALADLQRTLHSFKKGWITLRVPNCLIQHHLEEAADHITTILQLSADGLEDQWIEDEDEDDDDFDEDEDEDEWEEYD